MSYFFLKIRACQFSCIKIFYLLFSLIMIFIWYLYLVWKNCFSLEKRNNTNNNNISIFITLQLCEWNFFLVARYVIKNTNISYVFFLAINYFTPRPGPHLDVMEGLTIACRNIRSRIVLDVISQEGPPFLTRKVR